MKQELSALDLHYIIKELEILKNSRIDKIYQKGKIDFYFRFFVRNSGNKILRMKIPKLIYLTKKIGATPTIPPGYCAFLRKYLTNTWVKEIRQHGFDRVIEIFLEKNNAANGVTENYILILELFTPGNMILCKEDYTILSPLHGKDWTNRSIRKGLKYNFPPEMEDVFKISYSKFKAIIRGSDRENIVKTLAMDFGLGGVYAEEVCFKIIDKEKDKITEKEIKTLFESFSEVINRKLKPVIYNGKKGFPFFLKSFEGEIVEATSFSEVIDGLIVEKRKFDENKFEKIIEKQTENIEKIEIQIKEGTEIGNAIYNNYLIVKEILEDINKLRKEEGWFVAAEKYKDSKIVKEILENEGKVIIEL